MERVGDKPSVLAAYKAALDRWPDSLGASVGLANQHYALGHLKEAEGVLRRASAKHPDSVVVLNNLAQTLSDQGRNPEALALIDKARERTQREAPLAAAVAETRALIVQRMEKRK
jgi:predicted Zn-dependent protease